MAAACSCSVPISRSTGTTSRTTNGSDTKIVASTIPGSAKTTWIPCSVEPAAEPARAAVEEQEREPDDDRRERERQVDERVHEPLAAEALPDDRERADDAEDRVRRARRSARSAASARARAERLGRRDRVPGRAEPVLERAPEDEPDRRGEDHAR